MDEWTITEFLLRNKDTVLEDMMKDHILSNVITDSEKVDYLIWYVTFHLPISYEEANMIIDQSYLKKIGY